MISATSWLVAHGQGVNFIEKNGAVARGRKLAYLGSIGLPVKALTWLNSPTRLAANAPPEHDQETRPALRGEQS